MYSGVYSGVESGVRSGVESGVGSTIEDEQLRGAVKQALSHAVQTWTTAWRGGNQWASWYAFCSWFRDVGNLELKGDLWERFAADEELAIAGPQAWYPGVVAISDLPLEIHRDREGRSHREDGPAIVYADGWSVSAWHGIVVPDDFWSWDLQRVLSESNSEIRRCGIERIGWEKLTDRMTLVAEAPDPGNAPHMLRLFEGDLLAGMYARPARLLVAVNGSVDKGGDRRVFGIPVPASLGDPVEAAAALYDVPVEMYRRLARRS